MKATKDVTLQNYAVAATDRQYNVWLRDPLAIKVFNVQMAVQKLDYMHLNPLQSHWLLCADPAGYRFSSAIFYERILMNLGCLHILEKYFNGRKLSVRTPTTGRAIFYEQILMNLGCLHILEKYFNGRRLSVRTPTTGREYDKTSGHLGGNFILRG